MVWQVGLRTAISVYFALLSSLFWWCIDRTCSRTSKCSASSWHAPCTTSTTPVSPISTSSTLVSQPSLSPPCLSFSLCGSHSQRHKTVECPSVCRSVRPSICPSVCLSCRSTAAAACGGFAAERHARRTYRSIAGAGAQPNTDLFK